MQETDRQDFADLLEASLEVYGASLSAPAMHVWWKALAPYSIEQVRAALSEHIRRSVYVPKPADVISAINAHDGRPGAEEAWGIALSASDEGATVVWTDEIAAAKTACDEILAQGDEVGARMAFKERYEAEVREARAARRPVNWHASLGHDPDRRTSAIRDAYEQGRIGDSTVHHYLPKLDAVEITGARDKSEQKLLTDEGAKKQGANKADRVKDQKARENLRHLRGMLAGAVTAPDPTPDDGIAERTQAWAASRTAERTEHETASAGE